MFKIKSPNWLTIAIMYHYTIWFPLVICRPLYSTWLPKTLKLSSPETHRQSGFDDGSRKVQNSFRSDVTVMEEVTTIIPKQRVELKS